MLARIMAPDSPGPGPARAGPAGCCAGDPLRARASPMPPRLVGRDGSHPLRSPLHGPSPDRLRRQQRRGAAPQLGCRPRTPSPVCCVPPHHLPCTVPSPGGRYSFPSPFFSTGPCSVSQFLLSGPLRFPQRGLQAALRPPGPAGVFGSPPPGLSHPLRWGQQLAERHRDLHHLGRRCEEDRLGWLAEDPEGLTGWCRPPPLHRPRRALTVSEAVGPRCVVPGMGDRVAGKHLCERCVRMCPGCLVSFCHVAAALPVKTQSVGKQRQDHLFQAGKGMGMQAVPCGAALGWRGPGEQVLVLPESVLLPSPSSEEGTTLLRLLQKSP